MSEIAKFEEGAGGSHERYPNRQLVVQAKSMTQAEESVPVPVVYGRVRLAGIHSTPIWAFHALPIENVAPGK